MTHEEGDGRSGCGWIRHADGPVDPAGHRARLGHRRARRYRRQRRPPCDRQGPRRGRVRSAVGHHRLPHHPGCPHPDRRVPGGSIRPAAGVPHRGGLVHGRLGAVWGGPQSRLPGRSPGSARRGRGPAHPWQPGYHRGQFSPRRPGPGDRRLVGPRGAGHGDRAVRRRLAGVGRVVAAHLLPQRALGRHRAVRRPARARIQRPDRHRSPRRGRRRLRCDRPGRRRPTRSSKASPAAHRPSSPPLPRSASLASSPSWWSSGEVVTPCCPWTSSPPASSPPPIW